MKEEREDIALKENAKAILDHDMEQIDEQIIGRLRQIRRKAMAGKERRLTFKWNRFRILSATAIAGFLFAVISLTIVRTPSQTVTAKLIEDIDIFSSEVNIDFYEDLEFYTWLAERQNRNAT